MTIAQHLRRKRWLTIAPLASLAVAIVIRLATRAAEPDQFVSYFDLVSMLSFFCVTIGCLVMEQVGTASPRATEFLLGSVGSRPALIAPGERPTITMAAMMIGIVMSQWTERGSDDYISPLRWISTGLSMAAAMMALLTFLLVLLAKQRIALTAEGVTLSGGFGSRFVPWSALAPDSPRPGSSFGPVTLDVADPSTIRTSGLRRPSGTLIAASGIVDAGLIKFVIRHYTEHPEHRSAIGTPGEYARLRAQLGLSS